MPRKKKIRIGRSPKRSVTNVKHWEREQDRKQERKLKKATQLSGEKTFQCVDSNNIPSENVESDVQAWNESWFEDYLSTGSNEGSPTEQSDPSRESKELHDSDGFYAHEFYLVADKVIKYDPTTDVDELYQSRKSQRYNILNAELDEMQMKIKCETGYIKSKSQNVHFVDLYPTEIPGVRSVVTINSLFEAEVFVHRNKIGKDHALWEHLPQKYCTVTQVKNLLTELKNYDVCVGNPDEEFSHLNSGRQEHRESSFGARNGNMIYDATFRSNRCPLLVKALRCKECILKRGALRKRRHTEMNRKVPETPSMCSNVPHKMMTPGQINRKVKQLQKNRQFQNAKLKLLQKQLQKSTEICGQHRNDENTNNNNSLKEYSKIVKKEFQEMI